MATRPFYRSLAPFRLWWDLPRPVDWRAEMGREAPLHLEIGCGNGDWLAREAAVQPGVNWLAIEPEWSRVQKTLRKLSRVGHPAVRVLCAGAVVTLQRLVPPRTLAAVTCLFPEPWPKERHAKHRLFSRAFQELCASRLADGATARVVTDDGDYAGWVVDQAAPCFAVERGTVQVGHGTWFERLWASKGQRDFHELRLTKTHHPERSVAEDVPMQTHRLPSCDPAQLAPADLRGRPADGEIAVAFKEQFYDPARACVLLRATVAEPDLVQHLWVQVLQQGDGWHVRPAKGTGFVPTRGVQRLLDVVRDAVAASAA